MGRARSAVSVTASTADGGGGIAYLSFGCRGKLAAIPADLLFEMPGAGEVGIVAQLRDRHAGVPQAAQDPANRGPPRRTGDVRSASVPGGPAARSGVQPAAAKLRRPPDGG